MRGKRGLSIILLLILGFILIPNNVVFAEDDGYYFKSMNVNVEVLDNRKYIITETLNVYFNEDRHGIIRDIPKFTKNDKYTIEDVSVDGDIYEISDYSDLSIKIGNPDKKVKGDKKYVIKYTLNSYADTELDGDYLYLNILGTKWDTKIESFKATINFFDGAQFLDYKLTSGEYGSVTNEDFNVSAVDNKIYVESKSTIKPYNGATLNVKLPDGAFKNAKVYVPDCTINSDEVEINITEEKEYIVSRKLKIIKNNDNSAYVELWSGGTGDNAIIYDVIIDNEAFEVGTSYLRFPKTPGEYSVNVTFKVKPTLKSNIEFTLGNIFSDYKQENIQIKVVSPFDINGHSIKFMNKGSLQDESKYYTNIIDGKTLEFKTKDKEITKGQVTVTLNIDNELFTRDTPKSTLNMTIISIILVVISFLLYILFGREKKLNKALEYYPPDGLNSAEVGYIIDETINGTDITSLIFYWASKGYIKIESLKFDKIKLYKLKGLNREDSKDYELELFNKVFSYGKNNTVTNTSLRGKLYRDINIAKRKVKNTFKGERSLNNKNVLVLSIIVLILSFIPMMFLGGMSTQSTNEDIILGVSLSVIFIVPVLTVMYLFFKHNIKGIYKSKSIVVKITAILFSLIMYTGFYFCFTLVSEVDSVWLIANLASSYLMFITAIFIRKRTKYGREILQKVLGYKKFLEDAKKDNIEEVLSLNPEYFYNTLPYAQVLGVTKEWTSKFSDIAMKNPMWYHNYNEQLGHLFTDSFIKDMNNISNDSTYSPSSSGSGSSSDGGFSGGGYSGGGSGGGGGSSW